MTKPGYNPAQAEGEKRRATVALFARYLEIIEAQTSDPMATHPRLSLENLAWMCREGTKRIDELPIDKSSRWLGCIQGCLGMRGLIDMDEERDHSRPMFHAAYRLEGAVPPRLERTASSTETPADV